MALYVMPLPGTAVGQNTVSHCVHSMLTYLMVTEELSALDELMSHIFSPLHTIHYILLCAVVGQNTVCTSVNLTQKYTER